MAKSKNLKKKIRRLEARLQKGAKKLAKLKQKLEAATTVSVAKIKGDVKPAAAVKKPATVKKVKRKLNLSPERRAQLAAAMKARWAAKRAAAATPPQEKLSGPEFSPEGVSQPH
jgi:predicted RNase H-like nuclease (RuvC/YqgF family)